MVIYGELMDFNVDLMDINGDLMVILTGYSWLFYWWINGGQIVIYGDLIWLGILAIHIYIYYIILKPCFWGMSNWDMNENTLSYSIRSPPVENQFDGRWKVPQLHGIWEHHGAKWLILQQTMINYQRLSRNMITWNLWWCSFF